MDKIIIGTTLKDVLVSKEAFIGAHNSWFSFMGKELGKSQSEISKWQSREDWQDLVLEIMKERTRKDNVFLSDELLINKARALYHNLLLKELKPGNKYINQKAISKLSKLKKDSYLYLVTDYSAPFIYDLLKVVTDGDKLYSEIFSSNSSKFEGIEKSLGRFLKEYTPDIFVTSYKDLPLPKDCKVLGLEEFLKYDF